MTKTFGRVQRSALLSACALTALAAGQAYAQTMPATTPATAVAQDTTKAAATPPAADAGPALEEVIVTARKLKERLQDVPVTVTALTSQTIEHLQTKNIFNLAQQTPGLYFGTTGGRNGGNKLQIRNFSTGTAGPSKASVFIDGVYVPGDYASIPLANLDRIEVLKGPQSAYFGRATFVGAVNFVTRDPGNEVTGNIDLIGATKGEHDFTGYVSVPLIKDRLSTQLTFRDYAYAGPSERRTTDGYHLGDESTRAFSSKTVFNVTNDLTVKFNWAHVEDDDHIPATLYAPLNSRIPITRADGTIGYYFEGPTHIDFTSPNWGLPTSSLTNPGIHHQSDRYSLSYDWKLLGHTVSGYVSHGREQYKEQLDGNLYLSGTSPTVIPNALGVPTTATFASSFFNYNLGEEDTQAELRISSPQDQRLRYSVGYNYSDIGGHALLSTLANAYIFSSNGYGGSFLNPATDNSVFGSVAFDFTPQITLSFDGRYQHERINTKTYGLTAANFGQVLTSFSANYSTFLPRVNLQYKPTRNLQFYVLYSEGNNPGGFQPITPAQAAANNVNYAYAEESLKNYEGGMKSEWLNGRLILNVAAFHMDFTNEQLAQTTPIAGTPTGFASIYQPGVSSEVTGFEGEANAAVTRELQVRATIGYGKATYNNFCSAPYAALTGIQTGLNCRSVNGNQQEGTPALQTSLSGDYTHRVSDTLALYVRGDWEYQSKVYNEEFDYSWVPDFSTINLRVGAEIGEHITFEVFGRNLTDNDDSTRETRVTDSRAAAIAASYPSLGGFSQAIAGEQNIAGTAKKPRQFGVRVAYRF